MMKINTTAKEDIESLSYIPLIQLKQLIEQYISKYGEDAEFVIENFPGGETEYYISYKRLETDEEYNRRIDSEKKYKEMRRQQYETLKKEFEGDSK